MPPSPPSNYVAYTNGLNSENVENGHAPGDPVDPADYTQEEWDYHVMHANVVRAGGPDDPNLLPPPGEVEEDPLARRVRELEQQLAMLSGTQTRPPGAHLEAEPGAADVDEKAAVKGPPERRSPPANK
jgi:hypothetical protein